MQAYMQEALKYAAQDEQCLQDIIETFLKKMGMVEADFQRSMISHMSDPVKMQRIQRLRQEIEEKEFEYPEQTKETIDKINGIIMKNQMKEDTKRNDMTTCDKKEALKIQKLMFDLVISHQRELKKLPPDELQKELSIMTLKLGDKLYFTTGVESDELDAVTDRLQLEEDEEYKNMV